MKTKINILLIASVLVISLSSCKKKGCMDSEAMNYSASAEKSDGSCNYLYLSEISANVNSSFSLFAPDLYVNYGKASNTATWDYTTIVKDNQYNTTWDVTDIRMYNESWDFVLKDQDITSDETVLAGDFNPINDRNSSNQVILSGGNGNITFKFKVK